MPRDRTLLWLTALVVGALALRLAFCFWSTELVTTGARSYREYVTSATRLLDSSTLTSPLLIEDSDRRPSALMPPLYVGLVAGVYRVLGTETDAANLALQSINALATSLVVPFVFFATRRLARGRACWVAAVLAAFNPTLIGFTSHIWDTSLFTLGVTVAVWLTVRLSARPVGLRAAFLFGLYLGVLALLNPALTIAYPFLVLWMLSRSHGWRSRCILRGIAVTICGWLLAIAPWTVRNYVNFGELMYVRGGFMLELWLGVCPEADADGAAVYRARFPLRNPGEQRLLASLGERAYIDRCGRLAVEAIADDPGRLAYLIALRTLDYWAGTTFTHARPGEGGWPRSTPRAAIMLFVLGEILAIGFVLLVRRRLGGDVRWLLLIIISFSAIYCLTHVTIRFRSPTEPLLAMVAGLAVAATTSRTAAAGAKGASRTSGSDNRELTA